MVNCELIINVYIYLACGCTKLNCRGKNLLKKDLQRAIVVRIKLEKQLQDKINRVNKLKKQKDQKEKDLKRQLEHLDVRM